MKSFLKNNYMKVLACLVWVLGAFASYALGWQRIIGKGNNTDAIFDMYVFSWTQAIGFAVLFFGIGLSAFILACIYHKQKKD